MTLETINDYSVRLYVQSTLPALMHIKYILYLKLKSGVWHMPIIPVMGRLKQEDHEFKASLVTWQDTLSKKWKKREKLIQYRLLCTSLNYIYIYICM